MIQVIRIGGIEISTFVVTLSMGVVGMLACILMRRVNYALSIFRSALFAILLTAVGVAGAKLLFALENGLRAWDGVSFYGSVFLIPVMMPLVGLLFRLKPGQTMDLCGPCVAIMIACLRLGCFLTGCCGGWTVCLGSFCFAWPTQMMDSIGDFAILIWLLQKEDQTPQSGKLYPLFMIAYSAMRFFLEFLRDTPKDWLLLSHGQWFAVAALLVGFLWIGLQNHTANRNKG